MSDEPKVRRPHVLLGATGSIGVLKLPVYINALRALDVDFKVVLTPAADDFLPGRTLSHVADVATDAAPGEGHVTLARWADLVVILPCTANSLAAIAHGYAPNLLTTLVLAHRRPLLLFPAMNADMWAAKPVQRNVETLRSDGHRVVAPISSPVYEVASGDVVQGIAPPPVKQVLILVRDTLRERMEPPPIRVEMDA